MESYVIDCDSCGANPQACGDCLMSFLETTTIGQPVRFSADEKAALTVMAEVGLVPRLQLVA
ncbi:MAG: hypothetical protein LBE83_06505 [Propionibacteriaceae bacterium]|jgi:hypothetical protein|nr:hypothetical protein [Propionibacteriaceae bacterium]